LTELAILQSREIAVIEQQLELAAERRDYTESRWWVNWITADPFELVQNILGGGNVGRDRLQVAALEVEAANLIRRREEVATALARDVVDHVLEYEQLVRRLELLDIQIVTQQQRQAVLEVSYRMGEGSTINMLGIWQQTEDLLAKRVEMAIERGRLVTELEQLTGVPDDETWVDSGSGGGGSTGFVDHAAMEVSGEGSDPAGSFR
jgi:hypothetical protein